MPVVPSLEGSHCVRWCKNIGFVAINQDLCAFGGMFIVFNNLNLPFEF